MGVREKLKLAREAKGLTKADVGRQLGISRSEVSHIESGHVAFPSKEILHRMANLYGLDENDIFQGFGYTTSSPDIKPRSPHNALVDIQLGISSYIPVFDVPDGHDPVDFVSVGWSRPARNNVKGYRIAGLKYNEVVDPGDIIIINTESRPSQGDLVLASLNKEAFVGRFDGQVDNSKTLGVVTHVIKFLQEK